jgi:tetratricopeptide (TPR) repeat protein
LTVVGDAGVPLDRYACEHALDTAGRLELVARVCDAVQHAHEQGVIHRDLKPANILVEPSGQPKVLDFGVARAADLRAATAHTQTGQVVGTLNYMSPEQVAADPRLDQRSDVYTLGVILFELLAGRLPYPLEHLSLPEAARVIRDEEPTRLGSLDTRCRGDVETIAARALEKDPNRRYQSAGELAADIGRHLRHEPIRARPPSALYHLRKFARRHKALVVTTAVFLALLLGTGAVTAWQAIALARTERDQVVGQARRSREVHDALTRAVLLRQEARSAGGLGKWAEARAMARRAEALAESGPVEPGLPERIAVLLRELDEEQADRTLVARLEEIRLLQAEVKVKGGGFALERAFPRFRQAFADYGWQPASTKPAEAIDLLRRRPAVRSAAVAGLDDWLDLARWEKAAEVRWLEQVLAAADPDDWRQRLRLARRRRDRQALEDLGGKVKVATQPPQALVLLARVLHAHGSPSAELQLLRRAQDAYPGDFWINHNLGRALLDSRPPQLDEAIRFLTAAVALRPESPGARLNLGKALWQKGRLDEAGAAFRAIIARKHDYALAHFNLGIVLLGQKDLSGAGACFRRATEVDPKSVPAYLHLGDVLEGQGDLPGAERCWRRVTELEPNLPKVHASLGLLLQMRWDLPGAAASYRRALTLVPGYAEVHCNLGHVLLRQGNLRQALKEFQTGHDLGSRRKDWRYPSLQWIQRCQHFLELDRRLPAILKGESAPSGIAERIDLADLCRYKRLYAASVRFFTEAFAAEPKLADALWAGHRYRAACSAALGGCGAGEEATRLRRQALEWLRADLVGWTRYLQSATPKDAAQLQRVFRTWQLDLALAGVREADRLATLPATERAAWQKLWADVATGLAKARGAK